jgi:hypothetical protein
MGQIIAIFLFLLNLGSGLPFLTLGSFLDWACDWCPPESTIKIIAIIQHLNINIYFYWFEK